MNTDVHDQAQAGSCRGEYQTYLGDALESCDDYVGRLQGSIRGEIAPDRHYFVEKASALREWAAILVVRCEESKRWIEGGTP